MREKENYLQDCFAKANDVASFEALLRQKYPKIDWDGSATQILQHLKDYYSVKDQIELSTIPLQAKYQVRKDAAEKRFYRVTLPILCTTTILTTVGVTVAAVLLAGSITSCILIISAILALNFCGIALVLSRGDGTDLIKSELAREDAMVDIVLDTLPSLMFNLNEYHLYIDFKEMLSDVQTIAISFKPTDNSHFLNYQRECRTFIKGKDEGLMPTNHNNFSEDSKAYIKRCQDAKREHFGIDE